MRQQYDGHDKDQEQSTGQDEQGVAEADRGQQGGTDEIASPLERVL